MKYLFLVFVIFSNAALAVDYQKYNYHIQPHVLINLQKGYAAFHLSRGVVYKSLSDPAYLAAVDSGTLARFIGSNELKMTSRGYFPIPVKIADIIMQEEIERAGRSQEYLAFFRYLLTPYSNCYPSLSDLSLFIRAVQRNRLLVAGAESQYLEKVGKDGKVEYEVSPEFTTEIPLHDNYMDWFSANCGPKYISNVNLRDCETLAGVRELFNVFQEPGRPKSLKANDTRILTRLLLAGYPTMFESSGEMAVLTGTYLDELQAHFKGLVYFGDIKSLRKRHKVANSFTLIDLERDENGNIKNKLREQLNIAPILPVAAPVVNANQALIDEQFQLVDLKKLTADPALYQGKRLVFPCRILSMKFIAAQKSLYLKAQGHFLKLTHISKGYYLMLKDKVHMNKMTYHKHGDKGISYITPLYFSGTFKEIAQTKELVFEDLKSLSYSSTMPQLKSKN